MNVKAKVYRATIPIGSESEEYTGEYIVIPNTTEQQLETKDLLLKDNVTVKAIPEEYIIPTDTIDINNNGIVDVSTYKNANVNVPIPEGYVKPDGTKEISENGTHNVGDYEYVNVAVPTIDITQVGNMLIMR